MPGFVHLCRGVLQRLRPAIISEGWPTRRSTFVFDEVWPMSRRCVHHAVRRMVSRGGNVCRRARRGDEVENKRSNPASLFCEIRFARGCGSSPLACLLWHHLL